MFPLHRPQEQFGAEQRAFGVGQELFGAERLLFGPRARWTPAEFSGIAFGETALDSPPPEGLQGTNRIPSGASRSAEFNLIRGWSGAQRFGAGVEGFGPKSCNADYRLPRCGRQIYSSRLSRLEPAHCA